MAGVTNHRVNSALQGLQNQTKGYALGMEEFWAKRFVVIRIPKMKSSGMPWTKVSRRFYRPAGIGDLTVREWWEVICFFIDNPELVFKTLIVGSGCYQIILRTSTIEDEQEIKPYARITIKIKNKIKYRHRTIRLRAIPKDISEPVVHEIMKQCRCSFNPFILSPECPLHNDLRPKPTT